MLKAFKLQLDTAFPFLKSGKVLIAISGGMDSVVLTHLCKQANLNFALAHCNFNLRGEESNRDEAFVETLANTLDIEVFVEHFDTEAYAKNNKESIQMAARELRYQWFQELAEHLNFDYILTAHHADDNLETALINLSRGTGLDGLIGIPEVNRTIIRPLLAFTRTEIEAYAKEHSLEWRDDSSNASTKYLRNALRHNVIPKLKELNPELLQNFQATQHHLQETQQIVEDTIAKIQKKVVSVEGDLIKFNIKKLQKLSNPKPYLYQLLKDFNFTQWDDIVGLLNAQSGKQVFSKTHRLVKHRKHLLLTQKANDAFKNEAEQSICVNSDDARIKIPSGILFFDEADAIFGKRVDVAFVDKGLLKFPLIVRPWQKGDYFYPFGMSGKKKLSKFFKDEKLSLLDKENVWVLCSGDDIVWVINRRLDNRFRVTETTENSLKITFT